jgi:hypothetical protein
VTTAPNRYGLPAFYSLHAWVWKPNPAGQYAMWNPDDPLSGPGRAPGHRHAGTATRYRPVRTAHPC